MFLNNWSLADSKVWQDQFTIRKAKVERVVVKRRPQPPVVDLTLEYPNGKDRGKVGFALDFALYGRRVTSGGQVFDDTIKVYSGFSPEEILWVAQLPLLLDRFEVPFRDLLAEDEEES